MRNPRPYRALVASIFITLAVYHLFASEGWWRIGQVVVNLALLAFFMWLWWRQDVLEELDRLVTRATGNKTDGSVMYLAAHAHMHRRDVAAINEILRRYDVMRTPVDDLPPEARIVRETIESIIHL